MLALPQKIVLNIQNKYLQRIVSPKTTIMELDRLLGKSSFTSQTMLPGRIATTTNSRGGVKETNFYQTKIKLSQQSLAKLKWWKENLLLGNGTLLKIGMQLIIQTDASNTSWGAVCRGNITEGTWSYQKKTRHINVLELIAVKLVILTFTGVNRLQQSTYKYYSSVLLDKIESSSQSRTATSNQGNMGLSVSRSISNKVDWQSRNDKDSSDRKLNPNIFSQIGKIKEYLK